MTWAKQFIRAKIEEKATHVVLTITYNYYFVMEYTEVFVCDTISQAKTRLLTERSRDHLIVIDKTGKEKGQEIL